MLICNRHKFLFKFNNSNFSNKLSDSLFLSFVDTSAPLLHSLSTGALEGKQVLKRRNSWSEGFDIKSEDWSI